MTVRRRKLDGRENRPLKFKKSAARTLSCVCVEQNEMPLKPLNILLIIVPRLKMYVRTRSRAAAERAADRSGGRVDRQHARIACVAHVQQAGRWHRAVRGRRDVGRWQREQEGKHRGCG